MTHKSRQRSKYRVGDTVVVIKTGFVHYPAKVVATRNNQILHRPDRDFKTITEPGVDVVPFCRHTRTVRDDQPYRSYHDDQVCRLNEYDFTQSAIYDTWKEGDPKADADNQKEIEQPSPLTQEATMPGPFSAPEGSAPQTYQVTITTVVPGVNTDPSEWDLSVLLAAIHEHYWAEVKAVPMVPTEVK